MRPRLALICASLWLNLATLPAQLPQRDESEALEIEPPLLIHNGRPTAMTAKANDPDRLEIAVARARQSAAAGERFVRAGIISQAQAEERALKVVRLEEELAAARWLRAKSDSLAEPEIAKATEALALAKAKRETAERLFAEANLRRQRKLLALGSGRKADVERAAATLAALPGAPGN